MESSLDKQSDKVTISLTGDECLVLLDGGTITDRNNPFDPSAKVDIRQLTDVDPSYVPLTIAHPEFLKQLGGTTCRATVLGNSDIIVYVPREVVAMSNIVAEEIRAEVITGDPLMVPKGGIRVTFGAS